MRLGGHTWPQNPMMLNGLLDEVRKLDEKALVWGREKVLSTATERVGAATQRFAIGVQ